MARFDWKSWTRFRRMKVWQKCSLIAVPFLFPIAALLYLVVSQNNKDVEVALAEVRGLDYLRPLKDLNILLGRYRSLAERVGNGDKTAQAEMIKTTTQIDDAIAEVDQVDAKLGSEFKTGERKTWQKTKEEWAVAKAKGSTLSVAEANALYSKAIGQLQVVVQDVWEISNLILDPAANTYYLQDMMIANCLLGSEEMAKLQAIVAGAAARTAKDGKVTFTATELIDINIQLGKVQSLKENIEKETSRAVAANTGTEVKGKLESARDAFSTAVSTFSDKVRGLIDGAAIPADDVFAAGSAAITASSKLYQTLDPICVEQLHTRASGYQRVSYKAIAGTVIGLLLAALVAWLVTRGITQQINNLTHLFERIEAGDYQSRARVLSSDELGQMTEAINTTLDRTLTLIQSSDEKEQIQRSIMKLLDEVGGVGEGDLTKDAEVSADMTGAIADSFNYMMEQLRGIIGHVQLTTLQVSTAANQIHSSAGHLAQGSEHQAEQIVNTTAAIDEMAVSIQQVSENAALSSTVAEQALTIAKQGNGAVRNTIEGMNRIREQAQETSKRIKRLGETSQEIGQIVQLIDDIADRTSILALNASIQAAAAGEAGRGFAVVAEEVERLAVRSTEATKKIAALVKAIQGETNEAITAMDRSIQEVVSGSKVANQAGQSLQEIEQVSVRLAELIQQISLASKQQARGSETLAKSMSDISQITQQTASGTKQTAESVNSLAKLADELRNSVATFKLPASHQIRLQDSIRYQLAK
jgi:twitching motility protein PilJ